MTIQELFIQSNQALGAVIDQISADRWDVPLPLGMSNGPTTLDGAVRRHTYDDAWVPDVLAGKTKEEVGTIHESLLETPQADIISAYDTNNTIAINAVRDFTELDKIVHLSYGDFPAGEYLQHIVSFRAFRAYDIARLIGADTKLPDDLVQALWDEFTPVIENYRKMGVFPPAIEVPDDADLQTKLLAMVGKS
jgi:uncharacterized protein (TIGR03086 family)